MSGLGPLVDIEPAVARRAVEWLIELQAGSADRGVHEAHRIWLAQHAEHQRAWNHIEAVNERLRSGVGASAIAQAALAPPRSRQRRRVTTALAALFLGGGVAWQAGWHAPAHQALATWWADERTGVGERRTVALDDGSTLALNTDTAVDVRFSGGERRLRLLRGEIIVTTGPDGAATGPRPFVVETAHGELRPVGTRFSVREYGDASRVSVFEGRVSIRPKNELGEGRESFSRVLSAGQQARFTRSTISESRPANDADLAWTDGMLVASGMRLDDFLSELARHRRGHVRCDPAVAHLRVSGTYPLADTDRVLELLRTTLHVEVDTYTRWWIAVRRARG